MFFKKKQIPPEKKWVNPDVSRNRILSQHIGVDINKMHNMLCFLPQMEQEEYLKANLEQLNANYVIPDANGELYPVWKEFLESNGYHVQVLNVMDGAKSIPYNPFVYMSTEEDVEEITDILYTAFWNSLNNPAPREETPYAQHLLWMTLLYTYKQPEEQRTMMRAIEVLEQGYDETHPCAHLECLAGVNERCKGYYKCLQQLHPNRMRSLLIETTLCLTLFRLPEIRRMVCENLISIRALTRGKEAIFVVYPEMDTCIHPLVKIFYTQLIRELWRLHCHETFERRIMIAACPELYTGDWQTKELSKHNVEFTFFCKGIEQWEKQFGDKLQPDFCDVLVIAPYQSDSKTLQFVSGRIDVQPHYKKPSHKELRRMRQRPRVEPHYPTPGECVVCVGTEYARDTLLSMRKFYP